MWKPSSVDFVACILATNAGKKGSPVVNELLSTVIKSRGKLGRVIREIAWVVHVENRSIVFGRNA